MNGRRERGRLLLLMALLLSLLLPLSSAARAEDREVTVRFLTGDGAFDDGEIETQIIAPVEDGVYTVTMPEAPWRSYYLFTGWRLGDELLSAGEEYRGEAPVGDSVTVEAQWHIDPSTAIRLDLDPGEGTLAETSILIPPAGEAVLPAPYRNGFNFVGWCDDPGGAGDLLPAGSVLNPSDDMALYAQWEASTCVVTISVRHLGRSVTDISYALLKTEEGLVIPGESNGTGVFVFSEVPDGVYTLVLSDRIRQGSCGEILVEFGRVLGAELELEMWS